MRPISRDVLAREAAAKVAAADVGEATCAGAGKRWSHLEQQHRRAKADRQARIVVEVIRDEFCDECPALLACRRWAETQQYTGLAAGAAYERGHRKPASWVVPAGGRVRKEAS